MTHRCNYCKKEITNEEAAWEIEHRDTHGRVTDSIWFCEEHGEQLANLLGRSP